MFGLLLTLALFQGTPSTAPADTAPRAPAATQTSPIPRPPAGVAAKDSASATKVEPARTGPASVSDRLFSPGWVLFPARVVLVTILLALGLLAGSGGAWLAYRMAHSLRHTKWREPPRRLKRGEIGAAGASVALEWEDRIERNESQDAERDQQIATLREAVTELTELYNDLSAAVKLLVEGQASDERGSADDPG